MKAVTAGLMLLAIALTGCGVVEEAVRKNDDRYATPGAMDSPLTGVYNTYQFKLLDRYRISHQWFESGCGYRGVEQPSAPPGRRTHLYIGQDIVEKDGQTWLRYPDQRLFNFDRWVRSVKEVSREKGKEGTIYEIGFQPVCTQSWWTSSHYLDWYLRRSSLAEYEAKFSRTVPEGRWTSEVVNGLHWRVQRVPSDQLRQRGNGSGGPYQVWLIALGDSGYVMAVQMGASKESLDHPRAHAAIEGVLMHLVNSLKVEKLEP